MHTVCRLADFWTCLTQSHGKTLVKLMEIASNIEILLLQSIPVGDQSVKQLQSLQFSYAVRKLRDNVDHMHIEHCVFWV